MRDVVIIGAGVCGCAIARELSRYKLDVLVIDKCEDVCCGTSKANSAIVHAGYDAKEGTLKASLNVKGSKMMEQLCADLSVPYKRCGSFVVCTDENAREGLEVLYNRGIANGVEDLEIVDGKKAHEMEPNLSDDVVAALYAPSAAIVCPFTLTYALSENAAANGVEFLFDTKVENITPMEGFYSITTNKGDISASYVINAAGVYADEIHNMVSANKLSITARRGDYFLLDHTAGDYVSHVIFQLPTKLGKGVLVTPTVHGNILVGPTAIDVDDKEGVNTTKESLDSITERASISVKNPPLKQVITSFGGLRAHEAGDDFVIGFCDDVPNFLDVAGIESPGLSSAPAIGVMVASLISQDIEAVLKTDFIAKREGIMDPSKLSVKERNDLIKKNPAYGTIICRCESITEGEIVDAINRIPGAKSLDGVKRRVRAGMGRCQGGFCSPRVMEILSRELGIPLDEITKSGGESKVLVGKSKS